MFGNTQEISPQSVGVGSRAFPYDTIPYPGHSSLPDRRNEPAASTAAPLAALRFTAYSLQQLEKFLYVLDVFEKTYGI